MSIFHNQSVPHVESLQLRVQDVEKMKLFYTKTLGFKILEESSTRVTLGVEDHPILFLDASKPYVLKTGKRTGLYHFAILLPERKDLGSFLRHMVEIKYPLEGAADHLVSEAIYLSDPEGNGIEVYVDKEESKWPRGNGTIEMGTEMLNYQEILAIAETWNGMPKGTILGHMHLHVNDIDKNLKFYRDGLGLDLVLSYGTQAAFTSYAGYHHHLGMNTWNGVGALPTPESMTGLDYYTFAYPSFNDIEIIIKRLKEQGYTVSKEENQYRVKDPSGNSVVLQVSL